MPPSLIQANPEVFPFLTQLEAEGRLRPIRSCDPPITIPAWSVITTGKDPGELGTYGFRNRSSRDYLHYELSFSNRIKYPRIWDNLPEGKKAFVLGVPQSYPPGSINGVCISGILTPGLDSKWIEPQSEASRVLEVAGGHYLFDVSGYRTENRDKLMGELAQMLEQKDRLISTYLNQDFHLFMSVIIGSDRINHAFWKYVFEDHPRYEKCERYSDFFWNYYRKLDGLLNKWFQRAQEHGYRALILSDHGAKSLRGVFCLNDFLIEKGYLVLKQKVSENRVLEYSDVNWSKTSLWADGGYCGRIYVNKKGREPEGFVESVEGIYNQLNSDLNILSQAQNIEMNLHKTSSLYARCAGIAPDFILYVGGLDYRCGGRVSSGGLFLAENDTGPDGVNHDFFGVIAGDLSDFSPNSIQEIYPLIVSFLERD